jgi:hypothetical protein
MNSAIPTAEEFQKGDPSDFSLVLGGPLFQLLRRARLAGDALQLLHRRVIAQVLLTWLPLLLLSVAEGHAWDSSIKLPFLFDLELHIRFLLALPLLIIAELVVHERMRLVVDQFLARRLIPDAARANFDAALASATRLRNSVAAELLLIGVVYGVDALFVWRKQVALAVTSWYGVVVDGNLQQSLAGWWLGCVALPLFQFLLLRWYFRLFIWARFLWQVSRIKLELMPTHPDRCGGLGFLSSVSSAFSPLLLAQGMLLAGLIADRIFYAGAKLVEFKVELIGLVAVMVFAALGPLLAFTPKLAAVKRLGLQEYGALAQCYTREFAQKWLQGGAPPNEPLLGSADIQSLADLGNSFEVVKSMRLAPFTVQAVLQLLVVTLAPVAPLLLTMMPLEQLLSRMLNIVF